MTATKEDFFKPGKASARERAISTDTVAKQIIATEAAQRENKTERLRLLREARESAMPPAPAIVVRKKAAPSTRS